MSSTVNIKEALQTMKDRVSSLFRYAAEIASEMTSISLLRHLADEVEKQGHAICELLDAEVDKETINQAFLRASRACAPLQTYMVKGVDAFEDVNNDQEILSVAHDIKENCVCFLSEMAKSVDQQALVRGLNECMVREYEHMRQLRVLGSLLKRGAVHATS